MTKAIGLVGEKGSGKQTFVNFLKEIATPRHGGARNDKSGEIASSPSAPRNDGGGEIVANLTIRQVRFSDILAQTLILWDIALTRPNLQKLAIIMNDSFGAQALANAAKFSIEGDLADVIILDGVRRKAEFKLVKGMKNNLVIYITAEQNLRYQRLKTRSEKVGEVGLTFEQFLKEESSRAESEIPKLSKKADIKIENNGSLEEFKEKIRQLRIL